MIYIFGFFCFRDDMVFFLESFQLDQENIEKVLEEILNDKQKFFGSFFEKFGSMIIMKVLFVRVRRLSGDIIVSYISGVILL